MARKSRLEYPGACYHVINRGNYRAHLFQTAGARASFELCLAQGAERFHWRVHGWVVMGNHYHLAVETPDANLSAGMQWLQATFSARFNRFRAEHGHVFQGRYRAIHVEPGEALGQVCHYIDLNPVRAGLVTAAKLETYGYGSFSRLLQPRSRPDWYWPKSPLRAAGGLPDTARGREKYRSYLAWLMTELAAERETEYLKLCTGWAIGGDDFKAGLEHLGGQALDPRALDPTARVEWRRELWQQHLRKLLAKVPSRLQAETRPSAHWKAHLAAQMKRTSDVSNAWLAEKLAMSSAAYVSKQAGLAQRGALPSRKGDK